MFATITQTDSPPQINVVPSEVVNPMLKCTGCNREVTHVWLGKKDGDKFCTSCFDHPQSRITPGSTQTLSNGTVISNAHVADIRSRRVSPDGKVVWRETGRKYFTPK
jgi:rRNA maturation endonuclease Nob1